MKRLLRLLGPVVALTGSLGLVMYGRAMIGVFEVLMVGSLGPAPLPAALEELEWVTMSARHGVGGLVISCVATVMRDSGRAVSSIGRLLYTVAGVSLVMGAMPLAWAIIRA